jgi:hypothetical protein
MRQGSEDIEVQATSFIRDHGDAAYGMARSAMQEARSRGDAGLERFFAAVALAIAERTEK